MDLIGSSWAFIVSLVAVINGLGIVRLLGAFAEYLRRRKSVQMHHYWVYYLLTVFQLLVHVLLWWSILGLRDTGSLNFLRYLYLLIGPTLLFLATSVLIPDLDSKNVDMRTVYNDIRKDYFTMMPLVFVWGIFVWPVFVGAFAPTVPLLGAFAAMTAVLRFSANPKLHAVLVSAILLLYVAFVVLYAMQVGGVGNTMTQQ